MKKQIAMLAAITVGVTSLLTYQPMLARAESEAPLSSMFEESTIQDGMADQDIPLYTADGDENSALYDLAVANGFGKDTFSFVNHLCSLSNSDFEELLDNCTENVPNTLKLPFKGDAYKYIEHAGLCYGMTALSVLVHNGVIKPSEIQEGAETLHDVQLTYDVEKLLVQYAISQTYREVAFASGYYLDSHKKEERISDMLDCVTRSSENGKYCLIGFLISGGGAHAVTGIGKQTGNWEFDGISYDTCILTYDSNSIKKGTKESGFSDKVFIYVNSETNQFCIPAYETTSENGGAIQYALDQDNMLNYYGPIHGTTETQTDVSSIVKLAYYRYNLGTTKDSVVTNDGTTHSIEDLTTSGSGVSEHFLKDIASYQVEETGKQNTGVDAALYGVGYIARIQVEQHDRQFRAEVCKDNVSITNTGTDDVCATMYLIYDEGCYNDYPNYWTDYTVNVTPGQTITFTKQDNGFLVKSNNNSDLNGWFRFEPLDSYTESHFTDNATFSKWYGKRFVNLYSTQNQYLITFHTEENQEHVYVDLDNDGIYSDEVETGDANSDGTAYSAADAALMLHAIAIANCGSTETGICLNTNNCDLNQDGVLNSADVALLLMTGAKRGAGLE